MHDLAKADYDLLEWQADTFGRLLLVPATIFHLKFDAAASTLATAGKTFKELSRSGQDYAMKALAKTFDVSPGTICIGYEMRI